MEIEWRRFTTYPELQTGDIPGQDNPADLPSRGCTVSKLVETKWWERSSCLRLAEKNWPRAESTANEEEVNRERKKGNCDASSL